MAARVLVVGASGFVGRHLCRALLERGDEVWGLDRGGAPLLEGVQAFQGDLEHPETLADLPRTWDRVVHLAGLTVPGQVTTAAEAMRNVAMTVNLLEHLTSARLLVVSSCHVYAASQDPRREDSPARPAGLYGLSKLLVEEAALAALDRLDVRIARPFNHLGPGQRAELVIPTLLGRIRHLGPGTDPLHMAGMDSTRDFIDVRDVISAYLTLLDVDQPAHRVFNVCTGKGTRIGEMVHEVMDLCGVKREVIFEGHRISGDDNPTITGCNARLRALGWEPRHTVREALETMLAEVPRQAPSVRTAPPVTFPLAGRRIWITGGNGFLGKHVVAAFRKEGAEVLAPRSVELDLMDPGAARRFLETHRPDGVVHLAARVGGIGANRRQPGTFFHDNMAMGLHLIEACRQVGVEKLLVAGTVCAYPKFCPVPFREDDLWNGYPEETNAPYGIAKKALLVQMQSYRQEFGLRGIFLVPVNLYGPGDHTDLQNSHVIPALVRKFLEAKRAGSPFVELWGTGRASREFLFVEDAARGLCTAMASYEDPDPVNLGTGQEISIRDLAELLKRLTGFQGNLVFNPDYPDGQPRRQLDVTRARTRFGWEAQVGFEEGLRRTIAWVEEGL